MCPREWTAVEHNGLFKIFMDVSYQRIRQELRTGRLREPREVKLDPASWGCEEAHLLSQGGTTVTLVEAGRHFRLKGQCAQRPWGGPRLSLTKMASVRGGKAGKAERCGLSLRLRGRG